MIELNGAQEERAIRAYLCDGADVAVWLTGQFSGDQVTLVSGDTRVALTNMNSASGTLSLEGEAEVPFTTTLATGDAGLYRAEATFDGRDYTGGWIVLNDGYMVFTFYNGRLLLTELSGRTYTNGWTARLPCLKPARFPGSWELVNENRRKYERTPVH